MGSFRQRPEHNEKIRKTKEAKVAAKEAVARDPMLLSKPQKVAWLVGASWKTKREDGYARLFIDPLGLVHDGLRVDDAFAIQIARERSGTEEGRAAS